MKEQYSLTFKKQAIPGGGIFYIATTSNQEWSELAAHLTYSDSIETQGQIDAIVRLVERYNNGLLVNTFWGEVMGSFLEIYPANNTVEIGEEGTIISIPAFKEILQEWLAFIGD
jgi:hypothetical protein